MVHVIPVIHTLHTHGSGISAGIISALYRDYIGSVSIKVEKVYLHVYMGSTIIRQVRVFREEYIFRKILHFPVRFFMK